MDMCIPTTARLQNHPSQAVDRATILPDQDAAYQKLEDVGLGRDQRGCTISQPAPLFHTSHQIPVARIGPQLWPIYSRLIALVRQFGHFLDSNSCTIPVPWPIVFDRLVAQSATMEFAATIPKSKTNVLSPRQRAQSKSLSSWNCPIVSSG
jgi:hypothetical protein